MTKPFSLLAATAAATLLAGCHQEAPQAPVTVEHAWIRLPAVPGEPAAGYFAVTAAKDDVLTGVAAPGARIELHETTTMPAAGGASGMSGMRPLASVILPAGRQVRFAPGGKHLMIFGLDPALKRGDTFVLTFRFRSAPPVTAAARLLGPADVPPVNGDE